MGTYITDAGADKKTLAEIKTELETEFQTIFGNDIDLDASGSFGQIIGIFSKYLSELWDAWEEAYNCRNPDQASGICLDNIAIENAIERLPATYTAVINVLLYGDEGTIILAGKKAKKPLATVNFELDTTITISKTAARIGVIEVDGVVVPANTYTVIINATSYPYVAQGGDTKTDVLDGIEALITAGTWVGTASVANEQLTLSDLDLDYSFDITGDLDIVNIASGGDFTCDTIGAEVLPASSLTEIVTPVTGWDSVTNPSAGTTGREVETDEEFRIRRELSIISGNATDESIRSAVLNNVDSVTTCNVFSNRTDVTDGEGRPPHSFETVVQGGTDSDVADEIWIRMPSGIETYGNVNGGSGITIQDSLGHDQIIKFSRPADVYIFVKVRRNFNTEETYPANGDDLIKQAIVDWSLDTTNITVGVDVIRQRLIIPVYEIPGIDEVEILLDSSLTLPYTPTEVAANVTITDRQLAIFATDQIVVEVLP
jgi:uncharacterized phage protein gp47/JayE